jgi:hypothetical protein
MNIKTKFLKTKYLPEQLFLFAILILAILLIFITFKLLINISQKEKFVESEVPLIKTLINSQEIYLPKENIYRLFLKFDSKKGEFEISKIERDKGFLQRAPIDPNHQYILKVISKEGNEIYLTSFNVPTIFVAEDFSDPTQIQGNLNKLETAEVILPIPDVPNIEKIQIFSKDNPQVPLFERNLNNIIILENQNKENVVSKFNFKNIALAQQDTNPRCITLLNSGNPSLKHDITFIGTKEYKDVGEGEFIKDIVKGTIELFTYFPFNNYINGFNIHYVNKFDAECDFRGFPTCSNYSHLLTICPSDTLVITRNNIYGGYAWFGGDIFMGDASIQNLFTHEFGHAFGYLYDEYVYGGCGPNRNETCRSQGAIPQYDNCDNNNQCPKWQGLAGTGCFQGCNFADWYRGTENSIMRSLGATSFGPVNERSLNQRLFSKFGSLPFVNTPPNLIYIKGPNLGAKNKKINFYFSAVDYTHATDTLDLTIDWGDGTPTTKAKIKRNGEELIQTKTYRNTGTYYIKAKVKDSNLESDWSQPFVITILDKVPRPAINFTANPSTIRKGESSILTWSTQYADSCEASGAWSGRKPLSGQETVSPQKTSTYSLTCTGSGGSTTASVRITVR